MDASDEDKTRTTLREKITRENLFLKRFPGAPPIEDHNLLTKSDATKSTGNLNQRTYCNSSKKRSLNTVRKSKIIKPAKYYLDKLSEV